MNSRNSAPNQNSSTASELAANANNGGMKEQIDFLITTCGWSEEDILKAVKE